jgi:hypothetical protein
LFSASTIKLVIENKEDFMGVLDDMERRIEEERARVQAKKLQEKQQEAKKEAERAKEKLSGDNHLLW